jgi:hypothetical protein
MQSSREGAESSRRGSFKNDQEWGKRCFEDLDQRRMGRPATRTWSTDFLLQEGSSREETGKWLKKQVDTMAEAEKAAPSNDWYLSLRATDAEVWIHEQGGLYAL